jgi:Flp pilus assembly protein TadB
LKKLNITLSDKFTTPYPVYGSKEEIKEWCDSYDSYLKNLDEEDSLKFDYDMMRFLLLLALFSILFLGIFFYFSNFTSIIFMIAFILVTLPFLFFQLFSCRKRLFSIQLKKTTQPM